MWIYVGAIVSAVPSGTRHLLAQFFLDHVECVHAIIRELVEEQRLGNASEFRRSTRGKSVPIGEVLLPPPAAVHRRAPPSRKYYRHIPLHIVWQATLL